MIDIPASFDRRRYKIGSAIVVPLFLLWTHFMIGLRPEHVIISVLFLGFFWVGGDKGAYFAYLVLPFVIVGLSYDNLRLVLDFRGEIHVADLYAAELEWFGVETVNGRQILPTWFEDRTVPFLDLLCGSAYLLYLVEVVVIGIVLFFVDQKVLTLFAWGWCLLNLFGMATMIIYPAAPPWYVADYGMGPADLGALPSAAGAARFDALLEVDVFRSFYSRNANVFGAIPSLHCGYPTLVVCTIWRYGWKWRVPAIAFTGLVCFSAVYLQHHYVLDVLVGIVYAVLTYLLVGYLLRLRSHDRRSKQNRPADVVVVDPRTPPKGGVGTR